MKKVFALMLALALIYCPLVVCAQGENVLDTEYLFSFRGGIGWGMSPDKVIEIEGNPSEQTDDCLIYIDVLSAGFPSDVMYTFVDDALFSIKINIRKDLTEPIDYNWFYPSHIDDFDSIDDSLGAKYGEASVLREMSWSKKTMQSMEEMWGYAISLGHMEMTSVWKFRRFSITHLLKKGQTDRSFSHTITYSCFDVSGI